MTVKQTVLLVGGTGRTGRRVLEQFLDRNAGQDRLAVPFRQRV